MRIAKSPPRIQPVRRYRLFTTSFEVLFPFGLWPVNLNLAGWARECAGSRDQGAGILAEASYMDILRVPWHVEGSKNQNQNSPLGVSPAVVSTSLLVQISAKAERVATSICFSLDLPFTCDRVIYHSPKATSGKTAISSRDSNTTEIWAISFAVGHNRRCIEMVTRKKRLHGGRRINKALSSSC